MLPQTKISDILEKTYNIDSLQYYTLLLYRTITFNKHRSTQHTKYIQMWYLKPITLQPELQEWKGHQRRTKYW